MSDPTADLAKSLAWEVDRWSLRAWQEIDAAVDRAHAHATVALTETLRQTPDGRKSLRKASRSRSYAAAVADLDNLTAELAGPSTASLDGLLRDARESSYRVAFRGYLAIYPEEFSVGKDAEPPASRIVDARGLVLHGMELRREVGSKVDQAKRTLLAALEMAARKAEQPGRSADFLGGWKTRESSNLRTAARVAILDARTALEAIAGLDAAKPEIRPDDGFAPR